MTGKPKDLGPAGRTVAANVKAARGFMPYAELARRLDGHGRPIPPLGLRRLEAGTRRVDVDELVALAAVLGVMPQDLLGRRAPSRRPKP